MALNYSNLLTPNKTVQNLYGSLTQKTPAQSALSNYISPPLIKPPVGSQSVGAVGTAGGYDTAPQNPVKKVENKNTGITTHYDTSATVKPATTQNNASTSSQPVNNSAGTANPNANYFGQYNQQPATQQQQPQVQTPQQTPQQTPYASLLGTLKNTATDTSAVDNANQGLLKLRQDYATAVGNIEQQPIPLVFQQGREQVLARQYASQEAAQQAALTNALTARGQTISGLSSATGYAQPTQVSYNNQYIDPTTGLPVNPQAGQSMQDAVNLQVQKLRAGTTDPASAQAALSAYGQAGTNALQQALGSSFNPNISSANQSSAADLTNQVNTLQSIFNGVDANFKLLQSTAQQGGVNQGNVPVLNTLQQNVNRGLASNEAVINFRNTLAAVRSAYAQILGGGTTTVDSQNRAQEAIPDNISLDALKSLGVQLQKESQNRITGIQQQINTLSGGGNSGGGSGAVQAGGYNFKQDANGNWVAI